LIAVSDEPTLAPAQVNETRPRILMVRLGSMGDIIHSLPAVALLRGALPNAEIGWVIEERWAELLTSRTAASVVPRSPEQPLVDVVHTVDTRAWRNSLFARATIHQILSFRRNLRVQHYDIAIDLQSAVKSAVVAQVAAAPVRLGFERPIESPASLVYTRRAEARGRHIAEQNLSLAAAALPPGTPLPSLAEFEFPLPCDPEHEHWAEAERRRFGTFAIINPGAGWGAKCWPAERYAAVAGALKRHGITSLVNYGPGEEELAQAVVRAAPGAAEPLSCGVGQLIALTRRARLLVGGDTGPTHLAAALGVPVVAIYGPTDPARNGPIGSRAIVLRHESSVTSHSRRADAEAGLLQITADEAIAAARLLLAETAR